MVAASAVGCGALVEVAADWPSPGRVAESLWVCDWAGMSRQRLQELQDLIRGAEKARVLVVGEAPELFWAELAVRSGARGYLLKTAAPAEFVQAGREIAEGRMHFSAAVFIDLTRAIMNRRDSGGFPSGLSAQEIRVLRGLAQACGARQIAGELQLKVRTVESHVRNICRKLGVAGTAELRGFAPRLLEVLDEN